jgi:hypothetical protein
MLTRVLVILLVVLSSVSSMPNKISFGTRSKGSGFKKGNLLRSNQSDVSEILNTSISSVESVIEGSELDISIESDYDFDRSFLSDESSRNNKRKAKMRIV